MKCGSNFKAKVAWSNSMISNEISWHKISISTKHKNLSYIVQENRLGYIFVKMGQTQRSRSQGQNKLIPKERSYQKELNYEIWEPITRMSRFQTDMIKTSCPHPDFSHACIKMNQHNFGKFAFWNDLVW